MQSICYAHAKAPRNLFYRMRGEASTCVQSDTTDLPTMPCTARCPLSSLGPCKHTERHVHRFRCAFPVYSSTCSLTLNSQIRAFEDPAIPRVAVCKVDARKTFYRTHMQKSCMAFFQVRVQSPHFQPPSDLNFHCHTHGTKHHFNF